MKKIICLLCVAFLMILCGCEVNATHEKARGYEQSVFEGASFSNETISIYNINNIKIGEIERYGILLLTEDSIIYNKIPTGSAYSINEMAYYRFVFETSENIELGTVDNWTYEAKYDTTQRRRVLSDSLRRI